MKRIGAILGLLWLASTAEAAITTGPNTGGSSVSTNGFVSIAQVDASTNNPSLVRTNEQRVFNILYFGAVGDGVKDNVTNIQNAVMAAERVGGGTVYMPAGIYGLGNTNPLNEGFWTEDQPNLILIRSNVPIRFLGDGMGQTVLRSLGGGGYHILFGTGGTTNYAANYGTNFWQATNRLDFSNFTMDGATNAGIYDFTELFTDGTVTFDQMEFINSGIGDAIDVAGLGDVIVTGCRSRNMAGDITSTQVRNLLVSDCTFDGGGTRVEGDGKSPCFNNSDILASYVNTTVLNYSRIFAGDATAFQAVNCRFVSTNTAATNFTFTTTQMATFTDCQFEGVALNTIVHSGRGLKLLGCRFVMGGNGLDVLSIKPGELHIEGCTFGEALNPINQWNIRVQDGALDYTSMKGNVRIVNNTFGGFYYSVLDAIQFLGTNGAYNALISGNTFANKNVKFNSATNIVFTGNNWTTNGTLLATNMDYSIITENRFQSAPTLTIGNVNNEIKNNIGLANSQFTGNGAGLTNLTQVATGGYWQTNAAAASSVSNNFSVEHGPGTISSNAASENVGLVVNGNETIKGNTLSFASAGGTSAIKQNANGHLNILRSSSSGMAIYGSAGEVEVGSGGFYGFSSAATTDGGTKDVALGRSSAGVAEINSGTIGSYRDLRVRKITTSDTLTVTNPAAASNPFVRAQTNGIVTAYSYVTPTNSATHAPDFTKSAQLYVTNNNTLVLTQPTGIDSTKYQEMLYVVIGGGSNQVITTTGLGTTRLYGTWWVTNETQIKFQAWGNRFTNAIATPMF